MLTVCKPNLIDAHGDVPKRRRKKRQAIKLQRNEKVMRRLRSPRRIAQGYSATLLRAVRETKREVMALYNSVELPMFANQLGDLYIELPYQDNIENVANGVVSATNELHQDAFYKAANEAVGFDFKKFINEEGLTDILTASIDENVEALTDLSTASQRRVSEIVNRTLIENQGKTVSLRQELLAAFDIDANRAKFIARDQTQRLFKSLNQFRQEKAGIKKYKWLTSRDVRVRATHKDNSGKIFEWDNPSPITGHPGHDYNCRCTALAIISTG